jgi:hypothetical protein
VTLAKLLNIFKGSQNISMPAEILPKETDESRTEETDESPTARKVGMTIISAAIAAKNKKMVRRRGDNRTFCGLQDALGAPMRFGSSTWAPLFIEDILSFDWEIVEESPKAAFSINTVESDEEFTEACRGLNADAVSHLKLAMQHVAELDAIRERLQRLEEKALKHQGFQGALFFLFFLFLPVSCCFLVFLKSLSFLSLRCLTFAPPTFERNQYERLQSNPRTF